MTGSELKIGRHYGFRVRHSVEQPLLEDKVIEKDGRKAMIRVRHMGPPHPGLEEYVNVANMIVSWSARVKFLRDEERLEKARQASSEGDRVRQAAAAFVFSAMGEPLAPIYRNDGMFDVPFDVARRFAQRRPERTR